MDQQYHITHTTEVKAVIGKDWDPYLIGEKAARILQEPMMWFPFLLGRTFMLQRKVQYLEDFLRSSGQPLPPMPEVSGQEFLEWLEGIIEAPAKGEEVLGQIPKE